MVTGLLWLDVVAAVFGIILVTKFFTKQRSTPLPPGPKKLPILENLLDMPTSYEWITFAEWGKKWGIHPTLIPYFLFFNCSFGFYYRPYGDSFNTRPANDHRKFSENSIGHVGQKERDIL